ncbi:succinate dehydrogenase, hydrophobic membrane anchor protein [Acetobacteraceae bacterium H6797]|nr:succinate dehydrogenase, hydrophobic membrane anchor protein [Acetobacteraceae bacterium H6797]
MSNNNPRVTRMESPLARVRGLGTARSGTHHWLGMRITSIALLPLTIWFVISAISLMGASYETTIAWIGHPVNAVLMLALIAMTFHHMMNGLQEVVDDYVRPEGRRMAVNLLIRAICWLLGLSAALAVLRIAI